MTDILRSSSRLASAIRSKTGTVLRRPDISGAVRLDPRSTFSTTIGSATRTISAGNAMSITPTAAFGTIGLKGLLKKAMRN